MIIECGHCGAAAFAGASPRGRVGREKRHISWKSANPLHWHRRVEARLLGEASREAPVRRHCRGKRHLRRFSRRGASPPKREGWNSSKRGLLTWRSGLGSSLPRRSSLIRGSACFSVRESRSFPREPRWGEAPIEGGRRLRAEILSCKNSRWGSGMRGGLMELLLLRLGTRV
jgi:hypothetical protein